MKLFATGLLSLIFFIGYAQGDLQFNQALFIEFEGNFQLNGTIGQLVTQYDLVVPAGKTVKLNGALIADRNLSSNGAALTGGASYSALTLNSIRISGLNNGNTGNVTYPIWLPAGTYSFRIVTTSNLTTTSTYNAKVFLTGVEFNIIP